MRHFPLSTLCLAALLAAAAPARAAEPAADIEQVRSATTRLIHQLQEQGVLSRDKAQAMLVELAAPAPAQKPAVGAPAGLTTPADATRPSAGPGSVRVPYVPQFVRQDIKAEIKEELRAEAARDGWAGPGTVPAWVRSLRWDGDLRVREQYDNFLQNNAPAVSVYDTNRLRSITLLNTTQDRLRSRVRARLALTANVDENWSTSVRLTTGSLTDPLSSNQTLGTSGNRFTAAFDRAYLRYKAGDSFNVVAGRFGNPWYGTDLLWANDLGFDGVAAQWQPRVSDDLRGFVTAAALPIQEVELSKADKWLFGLQAGIEAAGGPGGISGKLGLGFFNFRNTVGKTSPTGSALNEFTAPQFAQKGNTYYNISSDAAKPLLGLASAFKLIDLTGSLDIPSVLGQHVVLTGDLVRNLGFKRSEVSARVGTDVAPKTRGLLLRAAFGDAEIHRSGDWQLFTAYKHLERDAVMDALTDSDFRLGGTDAKGYILGGSYGVGKNTAASLRYFSADSISGAPLSVDVLQLDLQVKF